MADSPRPTGRPRHHVEGIKRRPLTLHVTDAFKDDLSKGAKASGRSLTQEAEFHIRRSRDLDRDKDDVELRLEKTAAELMELVRQNFTAAGAEPRRAIYSEYGEPGEAARLLPVELDVTRGDDGNVVLIYRLNGRVIREIPIDNATALQLGEQLLAASGARREPASIAPKRQPKSRRG